VRVLVKGGTFITILCWVYGIVSYIKTPNNDNLAIWIFLFGGLILCVYAFLNE